MTHDDPTLPGTSKIVKLGGKARGAKSRLNPDDRGLVDFSPLLANPDDRG
jgi:hypothetical protein